MAPGLPAILLQRATARHRGGDAAGAISDLDKAIGVMRSGAKLPEGAEEPLEALLVVRGEIRRASGDAKGARADFEAALAARPGDPDAIAALAKIGR